MKRLYLLAKSWIYSLIYGPGLVTGPPPSTLKLTSGYDFVDFFWKWWDSLGKTQIMMSRGLSKIETSLWSASQWLTYQWSRYKHTGTRRGVGRTTRRATKLLRAYRIEAMDSLAMFRELSLDGMVGVAHFPPSVPGATAYRKLSWLNLEQGVKRVQAKYARDKS